MYVLGRLERERREYDRPVDIAFSPVIIPNLILRGSWVRTHTAGAHGVLCNNHAHNNDPLLTTRFVLYLPCIHCQSCCRCSLSCYVLK